jgi:hypothetical protein
MDTAIFVTNSDPRTIITAEALIPQSYFTIAMRDWQSFTQQLILRTDFNIAYIKLKNEDERRLPRRPSYERRRQSREWTAEASHFRSNNIKEDMYLDVTLI